jgi:hypothetical protein
MIFSVIWYFMSLWQLFEWHFLLNKWTNIVMDDWPKPYLPLPTTCDDILSRKIDI